MFQWQQQDVASAAAGSAACRWQTWHATASSPAGCQTLAAVGADHRDSGCCWNRLPKGVWLAASRVCLCTRAGSRDVVTLRRCKCTLVTLFAGTGPHTTQPACYHCSGVVSVAVSAAQVAASRLGLHVVLTAMRDDSMVITPHSLQSAAHRAAGWTAEDTSGLRLLRQVRQVVLQCSNAESDPHFASK